MTVPFEHTLAYYHYDLPEELIAQEPTARGEERLLVLERLNGRVSHRQFVDLPELLPKGSLLVANNSRVLPVRIPGIRTTGGKIECLLLAPVPLVEEASEEKDGVWSVESVVLLKPGRVVHIGDTVCLPDASASDALCVTVLAKGDFGRHTVILSWKGGKNGLSVFLKKYGKLPLPPYIRRAPTEEDSDTYQTIYARADKAGSAAAPTAGLHFTEDLRGKLADCGFLWTEVTLHVGYGTFAPVRENDIREHVMHREYIECPAETAEAVNRAKRDGRLVIPVGTTACRTLEGIARETACNGRNADDWIQPYAGWTDIFIRPGFDFRVADGLITNFHLPESTLLMLVSALAGHDNVFSAYKSAVAERYRFFSYGDAMLIR